jgi:hypothetical protein
VEGLESVQVVVEVQDLRVTEERRRGFWLGVFSVIASEVIIVGALLFDWGRL